MLAYSADGWRAYGVAIGLVVLATFLQYGLHFFEKDILDFAAFYPAVLLVTLLFGYRAGLFAIALSVFVVWLVFLPTEFAFELEARETLINVAFYAISSGLLVWLANIHRDIVKDLRDAQNMGQVLLGELRHRSRNNLAVTKTIIDNSLKADPTTAAVIYGRLAALMSADDLLVRESGAGEQLSTIVESELQPYGSERHEESGPEIVLAASNARAWALVVHELATNAAKYGALAQSGGKVLANWDTSGDALIFNWREIGIVAVPVSVAPSSGFGTKLIDAMVRSLGGTITRTFDAGGLRCSIAVPLPEIEVARIGRA